MTTKKTRLLVKYFLLGSGTILILVYFISSTVDFSNIYWRPFSELWPIVQGIFIFIVGLITLYFTWIRSRALDKQATIGERSLQNERFIKSIELLSLEDDRDDGDSVRVTKSRKTERIAAIYSLEALALEYINDNKFERAKSIIHVLANYIKDNSEDMYDINDLEALSRIGLPNDETYDMLDSSDEVKLAFQKSHELIELINNQLHGKEYHNYTDFGLDISNCYIAGISLKQGVGIYLGALGYSHLINCTLSKVRFHVGKHEKTWRTVYLRNCNLDQSELLCYLSEDSQSVYMLECIFNDGVFPTIFDYSQQNDSWYKSSIHNLDRHQQVGEIYNSIMGNTIRARRGTPDVFFSWKQNAPVIAHTPPINPLKDLEHDEIRGSIISQTKYGNKKNA